MEKQEERDAAYAAAVASTYGDPEDGGEVAAGGPQPGAEEPASEAGLSSPPESGDTADPVAPPAEAGEGGPAAPDIDGDQGGETSGVLPHALTMSGRLRATKEELAALRAELEELRAARPAAPPAGPGQEVPKAVEIPEALKGDAAEFDELEPQLAPLLRDPGSLGAALRKTLDKFGAVPAAQQARLAVLEHELASLKQARASETSSAAAQAHVEAIVSQHPEVRGLFGNDPVERIRSRQFKDAVELWALETKKDPQDRDAALAVLARGNANDVNLLLSEYKQSLAASRSAELGDDAKRRAALAGGVDNKRGAKPRATPRDARAEAIQAVYGS
ncbi:hypothetical protein [Solidesulfovibrio magneticus]|nr:hypothetical protein [Solidesulfovibrio magneticus]